MDPPPAPPLPEQEAGYHPSSSSTVGSASVSPKRRLSAAEGPPPGAGGGGKAAAGGSGNGGTNILAGKKGPPPAGAGGGGFTSGGASTPTSTASKSKSTTTNVPPLLAGKKGAVGGKNPHIDQLLANAAGARTDRNTGGGKGGKGPFSGPAMLVEKARFSARSDSDDSDDEKKDEEEDPQKVIADLESKDGFEKENDLVTFFKYKVAGDSSYTHSSIIGSADQRMPRSGKLNVTRQDYMTKLFCAVSFFFRQKRPLTLVEMATTRFRFYEDVDLFLPPTFPQDGLKKLESRWIEELLRIRGAVFGAIWRSDDVLGICQNCLKTTVHVFSSSGFSTNQSPKISLHFVWPHLVVTKREAKAIRSATIEFLRETTSQEQESLLQISFPEYRYDPDAEMTPWEEVYDAAPIEGASLKMPFNDKGTKPNRDTRQSAKLENRPKLPLGTFLVNLVASSLVDSTVELTVHPNEKDDIKWLADGSIRLDMDNPPPVANIWISASSRAIMANAGLLYGPPSATGTDAYGNPILAAGSAGGGGPPPGSYPINPHLHDPRYINQHELGVVPAGQDHDRNNAALLPAEEIAAQLQSKSRCVDVYEPIKTGLLGTWVDSKGVYLEVIPYEGCLDTRFKVGEIEISEDVFSSPVPIFFRHEENARLTSESEEEETRDLLLVGQGGTGGVREQSGGASPSKPKQAKNSKLYRGKGNSSGKSGKKRRTYVLHYTPGEPFGVWQDEEHETTAGEDEATSPSDGGEGEGEEDAMKNRRVGQLDVADAVDAVDESCDEDDSSSWMWRKPAVPLVGKWPPFGTEICVEVGESVVHGSGGSSSGPNPKEDGMVLAAKVYAIGQDERTGKLLTEEVWRGCVIFMSEDFDQLGDSGVNSSSGESAEKSTSTSVNPATGSIGSCAVGLRAVLDLTTNFIPVEKITALTVLANNPATEQAFNGVINQEYLQPLVEVVQNYKDDILDEFLLLTGDAIAVTKVDATQNKASKFAKEVRGMVVRGEDVPSCIGDFELFHAVIEGHRIWG